MAIIKQSKYTPIKTKERKIDQITSSSKNQKSILGKEKCLTGALKDKNMNCGGGGSRDRHFGQFPTILTNMDKVKSELRALRAEKSDLQVNAFYTPARNSSPAISPNNALGRS